ncbi:MAG: hypothetical protein KDC10_11240 [Calditrichaeota bacterium]|nr:hypothetical protein [Candidatus Cloacimonadota bacterium]MCA9787094.1 hypothetical protein [Candidatus Cloacimonadota bacterium]MCB1047759.1 hypothetical protein [Calditrichota bacterium]MCB9474236.1 hypothetical protein [Candidatus Delongbacteria bacterium]
MSLKPTLALALASTMLLACEKDKDLHSISLEVAGTSGRATVQYENNSGIRVLEDQPLPIVIQFVAEAGESVHVYASAPNPSATLWIQIVEDGEQVFASSGCLCGNTYVSAEAGGVVGAW